MLTTVEAYSPWKSVPLLPLSELGVQADFIQVRGITGLGPVDSEISTAAYGSLDGEAFTGAQVPKRNIVLTIGLNPDWNIWSMEALRRLLYLYFMPKKPVRLVFRSDDDFPPVEIFGYVENVVPTIFSKDGELQISIICPDPYFVAIEPTLIAGITTDDPVEVEYKGSVETGINVKVTEVSLPAPSVFEIASGDPSASSFVVFGTVSSTKYFVMNSVPGQKYIQNVTIGSGVITNLLAQMQEGTIWPTIQPGINQFFVTSDIGVQDWELTYYEKFGGL